MPEKRHDPWQELYRQLGRRIQDARKEAGLTQAELASEISLSRASVTNIEGGRQKILLHTLFQIAFVLNTNPAELLPEVQLVPSEKLSEKIPDDVSANERQWITSVLSQLEGGERDDAAQAD